MKPEWVVNSIAAGRVLPCKEAHQELVVLIYRSLLPINAARFNC